MVLPHSERKKVLRTCLSNQQFAERKENRFRICFGNIFPACDATQANVFEKVHDKAKDSFSTVCYDIVFSESPTIPWWLWNSSVK